jgi:hypothetical protein
VLGETLGDDCPEVAGGARDQGRLVFEDAVVPHYSIASPYTTSDPPTKLDHSSKNRCTSGFPIGSRLLR